MVINSGKLEYHSSQGEGHQKKLDKVPATNYSFRFFFYRELVPALISITDIAILSIVLIIYYLLKLVNQILLSRGAVRVNATWRTVNIGMFKFNLVVGRFSYESMLCEKN